MLCVCLVILAPFAVVLFLKSSLEALDFYPADLFRPIRFSK